MKSNKLIIALALLFFTVSSVLFANPSDSIAYRVMKQVELFPQEKLYVHHDKPYYMTGERVWFRAHLTNAQTHQYDTTSYYVYGELVDPMGEVQKRVKVMLRNGIYSGYFDLDADLADGNYTMHFYTKYMTNLSEDYHYKKNISVRGALSLSYQSVPSFSFNGNRLDVNLKFIDANSSAGLKPSAVRIRNQKGELVDQKLSSENQLKLQYNPSAKDYSNLLYLEWEYGGMIQKEYLSLPSKNDDFTVSIHPEGGHLMAGSENRIALKAINSQGLGEDLTYKLYNGKDKLLSELSSEHMGMNSFVFNPQLDETYYLLAKNDKDMTKRFDLPVALSEGLSLSVFSRGSTYGISLNSPQIKELNENVYLLIHSRGKVFYSQVWNNSQEVLSIQKAQLPSGIINFLLVDAEMNPISERLVFNRKRTDAISIELDSKPNYGKRSLIDLPIELFDDIGGISGSASVSVTSDADVLLDTSQTIASNLLLSSELKGYIENAAYYMQEGEKIDYALDLLLLTQGWRRYDLTKTLKGDYTVPEMPIESTTILSGRVKGGRFLKKNAKDVKINVLTSNPASFNSYTTDKEGYFSIPGYDLPDSTEYVVSAITQDGKERLDLEMDSLVWYSDDSSPLVKKQNFEIENKLRSYVKKADLKYVEDFGISAITLKEVEVVEVKKTKEELYIEKNRKPYLGMGTASLGRDRIKLSKALTIKELLLDLPRTRLGVSGDPSSLEVRMLNQEGRIIWVTPFYVVNGAENTDFENWGNIEDVGEVELFIEHEITWKPLTLGQAAIAITTTRDPNQSVKRPQYNTTRFSPLGYQHPIEFYAPKYETVEQKESSGSDLRTTIHWESNLRIVDGEASLSFYASDDSTTYSVVIEGITEEGIPFHAVKKISRK